MWEAAFVLALVAARLRPFRIEIAGDSMRPTLEPGEWCVATRTVRIRVGDVVVVRRPDRDIVKRITRGPGDEGCGFGEWFVEGDNPAASTDSRHFGPVRRDAVIGRVRYVYWPADRRRRVV